MLLAALFPTQVPAKPYLVLSPPSTVELGSERSRIALDGDVLTVLYRSSGAAVYLQGGVTEAMSRIEGTDLWGLRLKMAGWDRAFFGYGFSTSANAYAREGTWRGPKAPPSPIRAERLKGKLVERTLKSKALGETRKLFVYLPPNPAQGPLPAFFITDGSECERFARVLEPLILARRVRPCAIVGVDHGGYRGDLAMAPYDPKLNFRTKEYVPGVDPRRFDLHRRFFADEVLDYATREFKLSAHREDRAAMGYSDGARFVLSMASSRPHLFGSILPFSMYGPFPKPFPMDGPRVHLAAGTLEAPIDAYAKSLYQRIGPKRATLDLFVAGHDPEQWEIAFARLAPKVFPL